MLFGWWRTYPQFHLRVSYLPTLVGIPLSAFIWLLHLWHLHMRLLSLREDWKPLGSPRSHTCSCRFDRLHRKWMEHVPALSFLISCRVSPITSGRLMHFGSSLLPPGLWFLSCKNTNNTEGEKEEETVDGSIIHVCKSGPCVVVFSVETCDSSSNLLRWAAVVLSTQKMMCDCSHSRFPMAPSVFGFALSWNEDFSSLIAESFSHLTSSKWGETTCLVFVFSVWRMLLSASVTQCPDNRVPLETL